MAQGRQQNNGSRQRCAQSAAAKAPAEPPKAVCAQLEQLNRKRTVTVQELCEALNTSESTIRRDLTELDRLGKLNKVHGVAGCGAEAQHRAGGGKAHQRR